MASSHRGGAVIDAGLAADLIAAVAAGDEERRALSDELRALRDVSGFGSLGSARSVRAEILDSAARAVKQADELAVAWSSASAALRDAGWEALADDPARWSQQFVAERIESPVRRDRYREMSDTPPSRYRSFSLDDVTLPARRLQISGEWLPGLTFDRITVALSAMSHEPIIECAARWRYFATVLNRSVEAVAELLTARCGGDMSVDSTGITEVAKASTSIAMQWRVIGDSLHCFGGGLRGAREAVDTVAKDRGVAMAQCTNNVDMLARQPMIAESFERRARAVFDEHYSAGLFAFVAGMRSAGNPPVPMVHSHDDLAG